MKRSSLILLIVMLLFVAGCAQEEPTPEPTTAPTSAPSPEVDEPEATEMLPTETPEPTATPLPTETPEPSPTPISAESFIDMGDIQLLLSDWGGAEDAYRQAIEAEPENALAKARLSYLLHFHPETEQEAVEIGREAAELAPTDPVVGGFFILALLQVNEFEEALSVADRIDAYAFNNAFASSVLNDLYLTVGNYEEADRLNGVVIVTSGFASGIERVEIDRVLARNAFLNGNQSLAIQNSNHLQDIAPMFAPALLFRAEILIVGGTRGVTQRGLVIEGLTLDSDYLPLMVALARLDARAGNFELALDSCEDVIRLYPEQTDGLLCQGEVLLQQMLYEEAQAAFDQVVELDAADYRGYIGRGQAYLGLEDCEAAEAELETALEYHPYAVQTFITWGKVNQCLNKTAEAETAFEDALALRPFDHEAHFELGSFYLAQRRYDDAGPEFLRAISYSPEGGVPDTYYLSLGETLQSVGRCTVSGPTIEVTRYLCAGQFLIGIEFYLQAAESFNLALALDDDSFYALEGLVAAHANEGYCDAALSFLIRLGTIVEPRSTLVNIFDDNCASEIEGTTFVPDGELISESEAVELIETALLEIDGIEAPFIFFDSIDPDVAGISEQRVLIIEFTTGLERDSAELESLLYDTIFAATEGFVLTDTEPLFMVVRARLGLNDVPAGYVVSRNSAVLWYNGDLSTELFFLTWNSFDEIIETLEETEEG